MVFVKKANKGGKPNQKTPVKKPVKKEDVDMSDNDFDDDSMDSDEDVVVTKTPKGRQSLSEKRVSFHVPGGKNTPGKTPSKDNSLALKQVTPGKGGLQKFKGIEQNQKNSAKKNSKPADDEDDDEDDSDFDGELDLDLQDEGDSDEDEEDDEDEEEDDEDEEEDDEEEEESPKTLKNGKKQTVMLGKQTPLKSIEKQNAATPKTPKTPKDSQKSPNENKTPKSAKKETSEPKKNVVPVGESERREQRDSKQLYLGSLPIDVTAEDIQKLSTDIISVVLPTKRTNKKNAFAFLTFASEEKAEENYKKLSSKKFRGEALNIDYVGAKSTKRTKADQQKSKYNMKKLYISGLPLDVTIDQVAKFFPKSHTITLNQSASYRCANVSFWSDEDATEAFEATRDAEISGVKLSVLHSLATKNQQQRNNKRRKNDKRNQNSDQAAKKIKFMKDDSDDE